MNSRRQRRRPRTLAAVIALLAGSVTALAQDRVPVPDPEAEKQAQELIHEVYGQQHEAAKTSDEKSELAKKLLDQAAGARDEAANHFVLLRMARDVAAQAGDAETALAAVDRIVRTYEVDPVETKLECLTAVAQAAKLSSQHAALAAEAFSLCNAAVADDRFQAAGQFAEIARDSAQRARDYSLLKEIVARLDEIDGLREAHAAYQKAVARLEEEPADPEANLAAGRYLCVAKGDWERGIPMLALGSDPAVKAVAVEELEGAASAEDQVALGDAWWDVAETKQGREREAFRFRAGNWYEKAQAKLTSILVKAKVEKRLEEVAKIRPPGAEGAAGVEIVKRFDPATAELLETLQGDGGGVRSIAFSGDGSVLASGGTDHAVRVWDFAGRELRGVLPPLKNRGANVAISPSGSLLAVANADKSVSLWSTAKGQFRGALVAPAGRADCVAFSGDGLLLASAGDDKAVVLWNVTTGRARRTLGGHASRVWSVAFAADGSLVATGNQNGTVTIWEVATGAPRKRLMGHAWDVRCVAFSPDGSTLASSSKDRTVKLWDVATGELQWTLEGHSGEVWSVAFSPDGTFLASAGADKAIRVWDTATGELRRTLEGHTGLVWAVAFSPDGLYLASAGDDGTIKIWGAGTEKKPAEAQPAKGAAGNETTRAKTTPLGVAPPVAAPKLRFGPAPKVQPFDAANAALLDVLQAHNDYVRSLAFSPDGAILFSGGRSEPIVRLWDLATGRVRGTIGPPPSTLVPGKAYHVHALAISADGSTLAWGGGQPWTVKLWSPLRGELRQTQEGPHTADLQAVAVSPDGSLVASAGGDNEVRVWDAATGRLQRTLDGNEQVLSLAFSPDGSLLVSGEYRNRLAFWDTGSGELRDTLRGPSLVGSLAFSYDGSMLASSHHRNVVLWDVTTRARRWQLGGYTASPQCVAFHPDGSLLATCGGAVKLWDVATGELRRTLEGFDAAPSWAAFSPDGSILAVADHQKVRLFGEPKRQRGQRQKARGRRPRTR